MVCVTNLGTVITMRARENDNDVEAERPREAEQGAMPTQETSVHGFEWKHRGNAPIKFIIPMQLAVQAIVRGARLRIVVEEPQVWLLR